MKFVIKQNYMVLKIDEKEKCNVYTLIDLEDGTKITSVGVKSESELKHLDVVAAVVNLNVKAEKIETKKDGVKYLQIANTYVSEIEKVIA